MRSDWLRLTGRSPRPRPRSRGSELHQSGGLNGTHGRSVDVLAGVEVAKREVRSHIAIVNCPGLLAKCELQNCIIRVLRSAKCVGGVGFGNTLGDAPKAGYTEARARVRPRSQGGKAVAMRGSNGDTGNPLQACTHQMGMLRRGRGRQKQKLWVDVTTQTEVDRILMTRLTLIIHS